MHLPEIWLTTRYLLLRVNIITGSLNFVGQLKQARADRTGAVLERTPVEPAPKRSSVGSRRAQTTELLTRLFGQDCLAASSAAAAAMFGTPPVLQGPLHSLALAWLQSVGCHSGSTKHVCSNKFFFFSFCRKARFLWQEFS